MLDIKALKIAIEQLETERRIAREKLIDAIEQSLAAAYKKEYGKRGQIVRSTIDLDSGTVSFEQVKHVVDETTVRFDGEEDETDRNDKVELEEGVLERFNEEKHILIDDARRLKADAVLGEEIIFPLEPKDDFGRIAAQTAKQVIMQRIKEAERSSVMEEFGGKEGDIVSGYVQKHENGTVFIDFNRAVGILPYAEQIPGERYVRGARIRAYLYAVEETPRGVSLKLSRSHPKFLEKLFEAESPEVATGVVQLKAIAREPGSRSKIAVWTDDSNIDPVGSCVGQKGVRVSTVMSELSGEKIDIIEYSQDPAEFVQKSLSPAKVLDISLDEAERKATIEVLPDQLSLAIGKGGQNVRLAARLTGWKIDIKGTGDAVESVKEVVNEEAEAVEDDFVPLADLAKETTPEVVTEEVVEEKAPEEEVSEKE